MRLSSAIFIALLSTYVATQLVVTFVGRYSPVISYQTLFVVSTAVASFLVAFVMGGKKMKTRCHKALITQRYQTMLKRGEANVVDVITDMAHCAAIAVGEPASWQEYLPVGFKR